MTKSKHDRLHAMADYLAAMQTRMAKVAVNAAHDAYQSANGQHIGVSYSVTVTLYVKGQQTSTQTINGGLPRMLQRQAS